MRHNLRDNAATVGIDVAATEPTGERDFAFRPKQRQKIKKFYPEGHYREVVDAGRFLQRQVLGINPDFHPQGNARLTGARDEEACGLGQEATQANLIDRLAHSSALNRPMILAERIIPS